MISFSLSDFVYNKLVSDKILGIVYITAIFLMYSILDAAGSRRNRNVRKTRHNRWLGSESIVSDKIFIQNFKLLKPNDIR